MASDFEFVQGTPFGEWLRAQIFDAAYFETEAWAIDRVRRVEERSKSGGPVANAR